CGGVVGVEGFEPPTSCSQSRRATRLRYTPVCWVGPETAQAPVAEPGSRDALGGAPRGRLLFGMAHAAVNAATRAGLASWRLVGETSSFPPAPAARPSPDIHHTCISAAAGARGRRSQITMQVSVESTGNLERRMNFSLPAEQL